MDHRSMHAGAASRRLRDGLHDAAGWLRERGVPRARSLYATLGLALTVALALAAAALWGFVEVAEEVTEGDTLAVDRAILRWVEGRHGGWLEPVAVEVTALGSAPVVITVALLAAAFLVALRRRTDLLALLASLGGGLVLSGVLKMAYGRTRPDVFEWLVAGVGTASFPSGHALHAAILYTVLAAILGRLYGPGRGRRAVFAVAALLVALVAASRIYLGVHYPTDVVAGVAIGYAWAMACVLAGWLLEGSRTAAGP